MLNAVRYRIMLELQYEMNAVINPEWLQAEYPFLRAVVVEGGEALEHHGWKWWKHQTLDHDQLSMELVDIFHFYLSAALTGEHRKTGAVGAELIEQTANMLADCRERHIIFDGVSWPFDGISLLEMIELMIGLAVSRRYSMPLLLAAWEKLGGDVDGLCSMYLAKNLLNIFRQHHGYKEGTYQKLWMGREDNEHLTEIMNCLDPELPEYRGCVMSALKARYEAVTATAA